MIKGQRKFGQYQEGEGCIFSHAFDFFFGESKTGGQKVLPLGDQVQLFRGEGGGGVPSMGGISWKASTYENCRLCFLSLKWKQTPRGIMVKGRPFYYQSSYFDTISLSYCSAPPPLLCPCQIKFSPSPLCSSSCPRYDAFRTPTELSPSRPNSTVWSPAPEGRSADATSHTADTDSDAEAACVTEVCC